MMFNPWLAIPLEDYEGHMDAPDVRQLTALAELFTHALDRCLPESVAVLGIAGGNGLDRIDCATTKRIVGIDINQSYLEEVQRRFDALPGLELHCIDLAAQEPNLAPVALVHAALIVEHAGLNPALNTALSLVAPAGKISIVLQLPGDHANGIAATGYPCMQSLRHNFTLIDVGEVQRLLTLNGFRLLKQQTQSLPAGKAFWLGIFARR